MSVSTFTGCMSNALNNDKNRSNFVLSSLLEGTLKTTPIHSIIMFVREKYSWLPEVEGLLELTNFNPKTDYLEYLLFVYLVNLFRENKFLVSTYVSKFCIVGGRNSYIIIHFTNQFGGTLNILPKGIKVKLSKNNSFGGKFVRILYLYQSITWAKMTIFKNIYSHIFFLETQSLINVICSLNVFQTLYELYFITENDKYTFTTCKCYEEQLRKNDMNFATPIAYENIVSLPSSVKDASVDIFSSNKYEYMVLTPYNETNSYKVVGKVDDILNESECKYLVRMIKYKDGTNVAFLKEKPNVSSEPVPKKQKIL